MFNFDFRSTSINQSPSTSGVFPVKITGIEGYTSKSGNARIRIRAAVSEGECEGCTIVDGINLPTEENSKVKGIWLRFFASLGLTPSDVKESFSKDYKNLDDAVKHISKVLMDLKGYCYYAPAVGEGTYPTKKWLTPAQAEGARESSSAGTAASGSTASDALKDFINVR